jgi:Glycosyltransferase family 10 (fucosyltransferase) C-term
MMRIKMLNYYSYSPEPVIIDNFYFSAELPLSDADALLCLQPDDFFFRFKGPRAFYWQEPLSSFSGLRARKLRLFTKRLEKREILCHWNPDSLYRVPHITHMSEVSIRKEINRINRTVAVISNYGSTYKRLIRKEFFCNLRIKFALNAEVDLYGNKEQWHKFRLKLIAQPKCPSNFKGEIPGSWGLSGSKLDVISRYKAVICMENTIEPYYFTEKFVDAVRAGCIPIYHAHKTVRNGVLRGAKWVDPADFRFNVVDTIQFALAESIDDYWAVNEKWLENEAVSNTNFYQVFMRIGKILKGQI